MKAVTTKAQQLLRHAQLGRVMRVDLERGLMTVTMPEGFTVSKAPLALIPAAQAREAVDEVLGLAVFPVLMSEPRHFRWLNYMGCGYEVSDNGAEFTVYQDYRYDKKTELSTRSSPYWVGTVERKDSDGLEWRASLPRMVIDDFGVLVPVPKDAR